MPPARTTTQYKQTAAAPQDQGSGCLFSFAIVPPLAVVLISTLLASFAWKTEPLVLSPVIPIVLPSTQTPTDFPTQTLVVQLTNTQSPAITTETPTVIPTDSPTIVVAEAHIVSSTEIPVGVQAGFSPASSISSVLDSSQSISPIFTAEVQHWGADIVRWAAASQVDPNLAATVMQIESCGDPRATSKSGAIGLFQVMPFHFYITDSPYLPDTNAARGLAYLARSLEAARGDSRLALAGYNGGIGVINRIEWAWPAETKRYVQYGSPIYDDARSGASASNAVDEWYSKYGASLCRQAHQRLGLP